MNLGRHRTIRPSPRGNRFDALLLPELSRCPFYRTQCHHCGIPTLPQVSPAQNQSLLEEGIQKLGDQARGSVRQANLFGSGNVLNRVEISDETYLFALSRLRDSFPNMECLGVDTRPETALSWSGRRRIDQALAAISPVRFELIVGYETQDERLRTSPAGLNKKISEQCMRDVFALAQGLGLGLQINVMLMPVPTMALPEAVEEAVRTIQHIARLQQQFSIPVLINLNPLYINRRMLGTWGPAILESPLPSFQEIEVVVSRCSGLLPIFVGLDDDGLAIKKAY